MTVVRVEPQSVHTYGTEAQTQFTEIRAELEKLVTNVVEVRYFGPNAVDFKTKAGNLAAEFANSLSKDMGAVAESIRVSTTNIAASLGGRPITIQVNGSPITPPTVATVDYVDVDTAALDALKSTVSTHFATIEGKLEAHKAALGRTDWQGNAKEQAVGAVNTFTTGATNKCNEAQRALTEYITSQVSSTVSADR